MVMTWGWFNFSHWVNPTLLRLHGNVNSKLFDGLFFVGELFNLARQMRGKETSLAVGWCGSLATHLFPGWKRDLWGFKAIQT